MITLGDNLIGSQRRLLEQIAIGFQEGTHEFVTLKCRQIGCSTLSMALDLYWLFKYQGLNGVLVTHDDGARDQFRTTMELYYSGLPDEWTREILTHNRNQMVLDNGSKLQYRVAGTTQRASSKLGRGGAPALGHMTECAFWGDPNGIYSLKSSFAETNPVRFYHWESTANGLGNPFHDMWLDAKKSISVKAIFISFWANEFYRAARDSEIFQTYWGRAGRMTKDERDWTREVKLLYRVDVEPEQIAWYRWMGAEKLTDELMLAQEFPPTEERAFIATGSSFFKALDITKALKQCRVADAPDTYRIETGVDFKDLVVLPVKGKQATFKVWEEPVRGGIYAIGCDPSWASNPDSNNACVSVWRCWYNRLEQVAEFAANDVSTHACAWILAYIAGLYENSTMNIEVNGPGVEVLAELDNLKRTIGSKLASDVSEAMKKVMRSVKQYLYRRVDTLGGGFARHTKTSYEIKERMMNELRSYFEREILVVRSLDMVEEMKIVARQDGGAPAAPNHLRDDRVIAAGLAAMCWNDQLRSQLMATRVVWAPPTQEQDKGSKGATEKLVSKYFHRIGILKDDTGLPPPKKSIGRGRVPWGQTAARADKVSF